MKSENFKIETDQIIDTSNFAISSNRWTCKICYCLLINPKKCYNKKCGQICCAKCISNAMKNNQPCPFCKSQCDHMEYSSSSIDNGLVFILNNLKIICKHWGCKGRTYTIQAYLKHINLNPNYNEISSCHNKEHTDNEWYMLKQCNVCKKNFCRICFKMIRYDCEKNIVMCLSCETKANENNKRDDTKTSVINDTLVSQSDVKFIKCGVCEKDIKSLNDPAQVSKCEKCNNFTCVKCSHLCLICKRIICLKDWRSCSQCNFKYINSYICGDCSEENKNIFHSCKHCNKQYCISCVTVCNVCNEVLCCTDFKKCSSCCETMCTQHSHFCAMCFKDTEKVVCLKNCTYTCENCFEKSTVICNETVHSTWSSAVWFCRHQWCTNCIDCCFVCQSRQCQFCNEELNNKMWYCEICDNKLCFQCANFCFKCYKQFCGLHKCIGCDSIIDECYNCFIKEKNTYCGLCGNSLEQCDKCKKLLICSFKCWNKVKKNMNHWCDMGICSQCKVQFQQDNKGKSEDEINEDIMNWLDNSWIHRKRNYHDEGDDDKVEISCEESCICLLV